MVYPESFAEIWYGDINKQCIASVISSHYALAVGCVHFYPFSELYLFSWFLARIKPRHFVRFAKPAPHFSICELFVFSE